LAHSRYRKNKAFGYFQEGWNAPDVSEKMKIPLRTCQRWMTEFLEANPAIESNLVIVQEFATRATEVISSPPESVNELSWSSEAKKLVIEHQEIHTKVRRKLGDLLLAAMEQPEYNLRALHTLSQALLRHSEFERETLSLDMLNPDRAFQTLESYGYAVINPLDADNENKKVNCNS